MRSCPESKEDPVTRAGWFWRRYPSRRGCHDGAPTWGRSSLRLPQGTGAKLAQEGRAEATPEEREDTRSAVVCVRISTFVGPAPTVYTYYRFLFPRSAGELADEGREDHLLALETRDERTLLHDCLVLGVRDWRLVIAWMCVASSRS